VTSKDAPGAGDPEQDGDLERGDREGDAEVREVEVAGLDDRVAEDGCRGLSSVSAVAETGRAEQLRPHEPPIAARELVGERRMSSRLAGLAPRAQAH
jgi:hypothetical protein